MDWIRVSFEWALLIVRNHDYAVVSPNITSHKARTPTEHIDLFSSKSPLEE